MEYDRSDCYGLILKKKSIKDKEYATVESTQCISCSCITPIIYLNICSISQGLSKLYSIYLLFICDPHVTRCTMQNYKLVFIYFLTIEISCALARIVRFLHRCKTETCNLKCSRNRKAWSN